MTASFKSSYWTLTVIGIIVYTINYTKGNIEAMELKELIYVFINLDKHSEY